MGFGGSCFKVLNGIFSACFVIVGIALVAFGIFATYAILVSNNVHTIKEYLIVLPPALTVVLGALLLILVILGCCAICRETSGCMETYSVFLIFLAIAHIGLGVYCIMTYGNNTTTYFTLVDRITDDLELMVQDYRINPKPMDTVQIMFECCGSHGKSDYYDIPFPRSCCPDESHLCAKESNLPFRDGCAGKVLNFIFGSNYYIGWASLVVGATELLAALLGICLSCCVWRNQSSW